MDSIEILKFEIYEKIWTYHIHLLDDFLRF